ERVERTGYRDWAERLFVHDLGFVGDVREKRRLEKEAAFAALASGEDSGTLGPGVLHQGFYRSRAAAVGERTHPGVRFQAVADLHLGRALGEALHEGVVNAALHVEAGRGNADRSRV